MWMPWSLASAVSTTQPGFKGNRRKRISFIFGHIWVVEDSPFPICRLKQNYSSTAPKKKSISHQQHRTFIILHPSQNSHKILQVHCLIWIDSPVFSSVIHSPVETTVTNISPKKRFIIHESISFHILFFGVDRYHTTFSMTKKHGPVFVHRWAEFVHLQLASRREETLAARPGLGRGRGLGDRQGRSRGWKGEITRWPVNWWVKSTVGCALLMDS